MSDTEVPSLVFVPGRWTVGLHDGQQVSIRADGYGTRDDSIVFSVLIHGEPKSEFDVAVFPASSVSSIEGGPDV